MEPSVASLSRSIDAIMASRLPYLPLPKVVSDSVVYRPALNASTHREMNLRDGLENENLCITRTQMKGATLSW